MTSRLSSSCQSLVPAEPAEETDPWQASFPAVFNSTRQKPRSWLLDVARMIIVRSLASHLCSREVRHLCTAYCRAHARMALGSVGASAKTGSPQRLPEQGEQCAQVRVLGFLLRAFRRDQAWQGRCGSGSRRSKRSRRRSNASVRGFKALCVWIVLAGRGQAELVGRQGRVLSLELSARD